MASVTDYDVNKWETVPGTNMVIYPISEGTPPVAIRCVPGGYFNDPPGDRYTVTGGPEDAESVVVFDREQAYEAAKRIIESA